jgi:nucleoside-diphosphate-sugar epimerase
MPGTQSVNTVADTLLPASRAAGPRVRSVLVTGADGFVGRAVVRFLQQQGHRVRRVSRQAGVGGAAHTVRLDVGPLTEWGPALDGIDTVVHLAGCAHRRDASGAAVQREMFRVNTEGTRALATAARRSGVETLLFISSIAAAAECSGDAVDESVACRPQTIYGRSKLEAEGAIAAERGRMRAVILRPPLVYGRGAPGNFARLLQAVQRRWPLPFGAVRNRRSFIFLGNLADAIAVAIDDERADGIFHVADLRPVSTPEFIREIASAIDVPVRLWHLPPQWLVPGARLIGVGDTMRKLTESLPVDISRFRTCVGWNPPWDMQRALSESLRS